MTLTRRIAGALGREVADLAPLHGGDLSDVWLARLADGGRVVAKTGPRVAAEARMLRAMARAGAPVPGVRHQAGDLLLLDALNETPASDAGWAALGAGLRRLHISTADSYGWPEDYAFGSVGISNAPVSDWPRFWAENRLLAVPDCLPHDIRGRIDLLAHRLPDLLPASPPAALLHGDLWAGNVLFSGQNAFFIDPACYHGDGEVDLAMLRLFGAPPPPFFEGYGPPPAGHTARQPVYQLWPALVHLRLFGGGYRGMVTRLLDAADV